MWLVRAGEGGYLFDDFKKNAIVAIGWSKIGDLSRVQNRDEVRRMIETAYKDEKPGWKIVIPGQLSRFRFDFKEGDPILTYDPQSREYLVGKIKGPYYYDPTREDYKHVRKVQWDGTVPRDALSTSTRNTLGATTTIFDTGKDAEKEILGILSTGRAPEPSQDQQVEDHVKDQSNRARELIMDKVEALAWDDVQRLVAGILGAMGYKARVSPPGPDRGKDVEASPDGLGLTDPRIVVQVKHRSGQTGVKDLSSFIGILREGHKGLFVSTGGFSKDARHEAERSNIPVSLIDLDELVDLIVQYYDDFDPESKLLIPLTKIYWPT